MPSKKATSPDPGRLRWEGVVFNLICGVYFLFLSPLVISTVRSGLGDDTGEVAPAFWLGTLLLLAMGAEIWALPEKLKFVRTAMRQRNPEMQASTGIPYLQEEWSEMKRPGEFFRWLVSLLMALVPAVWSLP